jgi:putative RecB family exonuclease
VTIEATPLNQLLAFHGDHLVVIGDIGDPRLKRLTKRSLSASTAANILGCPTRFATEAVLDRVITPFSEAELGTATHKVLELLYQLPPDQRTTLAATNILNHLIETHPDEVCFPADPTQQAAWRSEVSNRLVGLWKIEDPRQVRVVETEMKFTGQTIGGVPSIGYIDRVEDVTPTGSDTGEDVRIVDYKSGNVKKPYRDSDPHGEQLRIYALGHQAARGKLPKSAAVLYVRHGQARDIDLSPRALRRTEESFARAWDILNGSREQGAYLSRPSPLCHWCPLATVCPTGIADGRNKRHSKQSIADFEAITEVGVHLQLPLITSIPTKRSTQERPMSALIRFGRLVEDKSWEERTNTSSDGQSDLNPNSFAAGAAFGLVEQAIRKLEQAKMVVTPAAVQALSRTFAAIVDQVQVEITGHHSFQEGTHARLRGALNQALYSFPVPFGTDAAGWAEWQQRVTKRVAALANAAHDLWACSRSAERFGETPWQALIGVQPQNAESTSEQPRTDQPAEPAAPTQPTAPAPAERATPAVDDYSPADEVGAPADDRYDPGTDF